MSQFEQCVYIYSSVCVCTYSCACIHIHVHRHIHIHIHTYTCTCTCTCTYIYTYTLYIYIYICIYIYIYICIASRVSFLIMFRCLHSLFVVDRCPPIVTCLLPATICIHTKPKGLCKLCAYVYAHMYSMCIVACAVAICWVAEGP